MKATVEVRLNHARPAESARIEVTVPDRESYLRLSAAVVKLVLDGDWKLDTAKTTGDSAES